MRPIKFVSVLALVFATGVPPRALSAQGLMVTGYADFEANVAGVGSDNSEFYFDNHHFNVIVMGTLVKNVFASAEVEYEHAGEEIGLEYGFISYIGFRNFRISAGKFIVPFGRFNKDLHPTWINKMPDQPLGFRHIMPGTYSDVGLWVSGGVPMGAAGARVVFDAFVVNGLLGDEASGIRGMRGNSTEELSAGGRDNNKAVGGRLGIDLAPQGLDVGASIYTGNYLDDPDDNLTLTLFGADAAYHYKGLELRAEGVIANQQTSGTDLKKKGAYGQAAYLLHSIFEPVVRFSLRDMPGDAEDQRRLSFGANYYVSANAILRIAYHLNMEKSGFEADNNNVVGQFTVVF